MYKRIALFSGSILIFLSGCILYGVFLNMKSSPLNEEMAKLKLKSITNPSIVIDRKDYTLTLFSDTIPVKKYRVVFGRNSEPKRIAGDKATPRGEYKILRIRFQIIFITNFSALIIRTFRI